jgi:succinate-semialdehyde dehydrogenase/glutarate-semialdehyde dehydrogenase
MTREKKAFTSINPANGEVVATYEAHTDAEVTTILDASGEAQTAWESLTVAARAVHLSALASRLREDVEPLARLMALEMGKPVAQGEAEIRKCADNCDFYAHNAVKFLADEPLTMEGAVVRYQPLGTVLAVMPWNFPFWQVLRCAGPVLMSGNTMALKHASNVMGCAMEIEHVCQRAGLPENVFRTLKISSSQVAAAIAHPSVAAVTLTGSEDAGRAVSAAAGLHLKPCVLELGGSDPFVVLGDADIDEAARVGAWARNQNGGQSCIAAKRFIVADAVFDTFVSKLSGEIGKLKVGDPLEKDTRIGPLARVDLRDELHDQVRRSVDLGAVLLMGGKVPEDRGAWYPPTLLAEVRPGVPAFDEETFGPVAAIVRARDEEEAVELANTSRFGLGASVWTRDARKGDHVASRIASGMVFINSMPRSDSRLPFGGVKASGYGRELWVQGLRSFANVKTVCSG